MWLQSSKYHQLSRDMRLSCSLSSVVEFVSVSPYVVDWVNGGNIGRSANWESLQFMSSLDPFFSMIIGYELSLAPSLWLSVRSMVWHCFPAYEIMIWSPSDGGANSYTRNSCPWIRSIDRTATEHERRFLGRWNRWAGLNRLKAYTHHCRLSYVDLLSEKIYIGEGLGGGHEGDEQVWHDDLSE